LPPLQHISATSPAGHLRKDKNCYSASALLQATVVLCQRLLAYSAYTCARRSIFRPCPCVVLPSVRFVPVECTTIKAPHATCPTVAPFVSMVRAAASSSISGCRGLPWIAHLAASPSPCAGRRAPPWLRAPLGAVGVPSLTLERHRAAVAAPSSVSRRSGVSCPHFFVMACS
jgi:hypothetical protein